MEQKQQEERKRTRETLPNIEQQQSQKHKKLRRIENLCRIFNADHRFLIQFHGAFGIWLAGCVCMWWLMWNDMWKTNGYYIIISPAIDSEPTMMVKFSMRVWVLECRLPFSVCSQPKFQSRDDFWEKVFDSGKGPQKTYLIININTQRESRSLASSSSKKRRSRPYFHHGLLPLFIPTIGKFCLVTCVCCCNVFFECCRLSSTLLRLLFLLL